MVKRVISAISKQISGLQRAAFWLALFSGLSLILGFLRDRILAHHFGAGLELDIYYASFEIPDILFATIASLASASILIPIFSEKQEREDELKHFINGVFSSFSLLLIIFSVIAFIFMPELVRLFFGGFDVNKMSSVVSFSRILILSPVFLGLSSFFGSIIQFERKFLLYSLSPLLYNLGIIVALVFGVEKFGVSSAVFGVVSGAFLHMVLQAFFVFRSKESPRLTRDIFSKEVRKTLFLSVPRTISLSVSSLVGLFFVALASKMPDGSIAAFTLSLNLQSVLLSLIGASFSLAAFPTLAAHYAKNEIESLSLCLSLGLRHIIFWSVPASALFIVLRAHIVRTVLGSGSFDWSDTRITAAALGLFVASVVFQSAQLFLTRAHYAFGKTKLPLLINIIGASITVFLAILFLEYKNIFDSIITPLATLLKAEDLVRLPVLALPLAFSIGAFFSALFLFLSLPKFLKTHLYPEVIDAFGDSFIAASGLVLVTALGLRLFNDYLVLDTLINVFLHGLLSGLLGIVAWVCILFILKNKETREIISR